MTNGQVTDGPITNPKFKGEWFPAISFINAGDTVQIVNEEPPKDVITPILKVKTDCSLTRHVEKNSQMLAQFISPLAVVLYNMT